MHAVRGKGELLPGLNADRALSGRNHTGRNVGEVGLQLPEETRRVHRHHRHPPTAHWAHSPASYPFTSRDPGSLEILGTTASMHQSTNTREG